jgi:hypothetical protein
VPENDTNSLPSTMAMYSIYRGLDQLGIVGQVAPGIFAQEGRCWRFVPAGQASHCMAPVAWRGRYRYSSGWKPVWSCDGHADDLIGARRSGDLAIANQVPASWRDSQC